MASSFLVAVGFFVAEKQGYHLASHAKLIYAVLLTTVCWVIAAYAAPPTDEATLVNFYRKVKPFGPGWRRFQQAEGLAPAEASTGENIPLALLGWVTGCAAIWSSLFAVGNFLYGRTGYALLCTAVFAVSGFLLLRVVTRLWQAKGAGDTGF
jgi:hypothetical protein